MKTAIEEVLIQQRDINSLLIDRIKNLETVTLEQYKTLNKIIEALNKDTDNINTISDIVKNSFLIREN